MVTIRPATTGDHGTLTASLASAFSEDPLFGWIAGVDGGPTQEAKMKIFIGMFLKLNLAKPDHLVFTSEDGTGGAIWQAPDKWKVPTGDLVRGLPAMIRAFGRRMPAMMSALTTIEKVHPKAPHYYLEVLGTRQDTQSKGVGSAVITHILERCDEEGLPAYLESSNPRNVPFYARHGFETTQELRMGKKEDGPLVTLMWREPRG